MISNHRNKINAEREAARLRRTGHEAHAQKIDDKHWIVKSWKGRR